MNYSEVLIALYSGVASGGEVAQKEDWKSALLEDILLKGFPPLLLAQESLDYGMEARLTPIQEVRSSLSTATARGPGLDSQRRPCIFTFFIFH